MSISRIQDRQQFVNVAQDRLPQVAVGENCAELQEDWANVEFIRPKYSRAQVDKAGEALVTEALSSALRDAALPLVNNWRSSHAYPLQCYYVTLKKRAEDADSHAAVAQRMKRLSSISAKLERNRPTPENPERAKMRLTQMQDIGGCRAILKDVSSVKKLVQFYKSNRYTEDVYREKDYIAQPKDDGYRCVHLVYKYHTNSKSEDLKAFDKLLIEIQFRSRQQHLWATAVEIVDTFTSQNIKLGRGREDWKRFLALMSNDIAARERSPLVPGTPTNLRELKEELSFLVRELKVEDAMEGWQAFVEVVDPAELKAAETIVLELDPKLRRLRIHPFRKEELADAEELSFHLEKQHENDTVQVVRVSANSVKSLKSAFPNFYLNASSFLSAVRRAIGVTGSPSASPSA